MYGATGRHLGDVPLGVPLDDGTVALTMKRSALAVLLGDAARHAGADVRLGAEVASVHDDAEGVRAVLTDGSVVTGDLLVAADGVRSPVRRQIDPAAPEARYVGLTNFGGITRGTRLGDDLTPQAWHFVFGRRSFFGAHPLPTGDVVWFANVPRPEIGRDERAATTEQQWLGWLASLVADDAGPASALVAAGRLELAGDSTFDLPHVPTWWRGRTVLVGDAAHAPSPSSGQGAAMALEDAVVLARSVAAARRRRARCLRGGPAHPRRGDREGRRAQQQRQDPRPARPRAARDDAQPGLPLRRRGARDRRLHGAPAGGGAHPHALRSRRTCGERLSPRAPGIAQDVGVNTSDDAGAAAPTTAASTSADSTTVGSTTLGPVAAGALVFGASAAVLVVELTALRLLAPYLGLTLETSTLVIGMALAAIALGAWAGGQAADRMPPRRALGPLLAGSGVAVALMPFLVRGAGEAAGASGALLMAMVAILVPGALLSAVPPMVTKLRLTDLAETGTVVGRLSGLGTVGAIVGTVLTGYVFIAAIPVSSVLVGLGILLVVAAAAVEWRVRGARAAVLPLLLLVPGALGAAFGPGRCDAETVYHCAEVLADPQRDHRAGAGARRAAALLRRPRRPHPPRVRVRAGDGGGLRHRLRPGPEPVGLPPRRRRADPAALPGGGAAGHDQRGLRDRPRRARPRRRAAGAGDRARARGAGRGRPARPAAAAGGLARPRRG